MSSVNFSPFTSIFENKSAGTAIIGMPGAGKSFFLLNLIANSLMMEQPVFALDPKDDLGVIADIFPNVDYIDINNIQPGSLNPFSVLKKVDTNIICSLISIICGNLTDEQIIVITPIVNDFINQHKANKNSTLTFSSVADYLFANDNHDSQVIGTKLRIHRDSKYGPLLFADEDDHKSVLGNQDHSKIISLFGMDLPKPNVKNLTEEQKFNSGIIYIICNMLKELLTSIKYPTLFVMDEAHIALKNESFSSIIDEFLVLGRSLNIATILATQNASHYPEGIAQLISNKFCFKSSTDEASKFLDMFFNKNYDNNADFDSIIGQIGNFESGQCFYIDSMNRSGMFLVTSLLGDDITSNPLMKKRNKGGKESGN